MESAIQATIQDPPETAARFIEQVRPHHLYGAIPISLPLQPLPGWRVSISIAVNVKVKRLALNRFLFE